jgi:hypothetical protein
MYHVGVMLRREFLMTAGATVLRPAQPDVPPDSLTNPHGLEYFLLGNGLITVGVQAAPVREAGANCGLVVMSPDHMNRKAGSLLWSPRAGLEGTRCTVLVGTTAYTPEPGRAEVAWHYPDGTPTVRIRWSAGACRVTEDLFCPIGHAAPLRTVTVENAGAAPAEVRLTATLRQNPLLFDEYEVDRERGVLAPPRRPGNRKRAARSPVPRRHARLPRRGRPLGQDGRRHLAVPPRVGPRCGHVGLRRHPGRHARDRRGHAGPHRDAHGQ